MYNINVSLVYRVHGNRSVLEYKFRLSTTMSQKLILMLDRQKLKKITLVNNPVN